MLSDLGLLGDDVLLPVRPDMSLRPDARLENVLK